MQFNFLASSLVALAVTSVCATAAPTKAGTAVAGQATFVVSYQLSGLTRYRFNYSGVDGINFVHAFQSCGGIANNWQSWNQDGHGVFDDGEVNGIVGARVISCGIHAVTGQDCHSIGEVGC